MKQLAGFRRVTLQPRDKQTASFSLSHDHIALRYWDDAKQQFEHELGPVQLMIDASSADIRLRGYIDLV